MTNGDHMPEGPPLGLRAPSAVAAEGRVSAAGSSIRTMHELISAKRWWGSPGLSRRRASRTIQKLVRTLSGGAVIVVKHSAEAASTSDCSVAPGELGIRGNDKVADALMISLAVIVRHELRPTSDHTGLEKP